MKNPANRGDRIGGVKYSNGGSSPAERMQAFDMLPKKLRRAIADAPYNFDTIEIARWLRDGLAPTRAEIHVLMTSRQIVELAYAERGGPA